MAVSVGHLRESLITVATTIRSQSSVHVNVVLDIVELGVGLSAVLANQQLIWPMRILV